MDVAPGTIVIWSDIACPWAHCAVSRLHRYRRQLGLDDDVRFDHRAFPLELFNDRPSPFRVLAAEIPVVHALEPDAGWQVWQRPLSEWPVSTLLALEAVQAAKEQGPVASEQLDLALRRALFGESRCVSLRSVVVEAAKACEAVDVDALSAAIDDGRARATLIRQWRTAESSDVKGSPHLFLPDGGDAHNPGIRMHWAGDPGRGFPVIDADDPSVYEGLLRRAT